MLMLTIFILRLICSLSLCWLHCPLSIVDSANKGYIAADVLEELLTAKGTPFRPKELENFFNVAKEPETGHIYYEDYVALLTKRPEK